MKKSRVWLILLLVIGVGTVLVLLNFNKYFLYKAYIKLFNKSTIIAHYNSRGQLDGEYIAYVNGKVYGETNFKNGVKDGLSVLYNDTTGNKKSEIFYKFGKLDGVENEYYKSGRLNYTVCWKNDRHCKSEYHYLENGRLNNYNAFDASNNKNIDNCYCYVFYDNGKFHQILGDVFSSFIYSKYHDSVIALTDKSKYKFIKDLYIDVATPPQLYRETEVYINNKKINFAEIKENLLTVSNVFKDAGTYQIFISGKLMLKNGKTAKADTLKTAIVKL